MIGFGTIHTSKISKIHNDTVQFRIRDSKVLYHYILPIFDKYNLLTSKEFSYIQFRKALLIYLDQSIPKNDKDTQITILKNSILPNNYIPSS